MNKNKPLGWAASSVDPEQLSLTVKSVIIGLGGIITIIFSLFGIAILPDQIQQFGQMVGAIVGLAVTFGSSITTIYGLIRKVLHQKISE